ncbi:MAG: FHA domain-containing protein [Paracoccaceae bacterium]
MIKDIVVRRRPSSDPVPQNDEELDQIQAALNAVKPEPPLVETVADTDDVPSNGFKDLDLARAVNARNFVPKHEVTPCRDQPNWNKPEIEKNVEHGVGPKQKRVTSTPKIWDVKPEAILPPPIASASQAAQQMSHGYNAVERQTENQQPAPHIQRRVSSERVKTRLLGFHADKENADLFAAAVTKADGNEPRFPIGWLVITEGPGLGASFTLTSGLSTIGRDMNQSVSLDFGDTSISRERHVSIAYDDEENRVYVGHGGKSNIVRHNSKPLLTTEELSHGDTIKIGKTQLSFVAFCTPDFSWKGIEAEQLGGTRDE